MTQLGLFCISVIAASLLPGSPGDAKSDREPGPRYDPATVINVSGLIQDVRELADPIALRGVNLTLKTEKRVVQVYLGPADFLKAFELRLAKRDYIQVSGSKVRFGGSDIILARQVRKDKEVLVLRDEGGKPYWEDQVFKNF